MPHTSEHKSIERTDCLDSGCLPERFWLPLRYVRLVIDVRSEIPFNNLKVLQMLCHKYLWGARIEV